jgi:hypothetical protein
MSEDVESGHLDLAKKWFQPRHYYDVVEERSCSGKCGFPLCLKNVASSPGSKLRISYMDKKIYDDQMSSKYCSSSCIERSQIFAGTLEESSPLTRKWVSALNPVEGRYVHIRTSAIVIYVLNVDKGGIDDILNVLSLDEKTPETKEAARITTEMFTPTRSAGVSMSGVRKMISEAKAAGPGGSGTIREPLVVADNEVKRLPYSSSPPRRYIDTGTGWSESASPDKHSLAEIDTHMQSLFTPSLLSYDPVHTMPPKHTPLATQPAPQVEGVDRRPTPAAPPTRSPEKQTEVVHGILKASSEADLESLQNTSVKSPDVRPGGGRNLIKKNLSFGEDTVRVFKRGSKATALYTERDLLEGKIPSNYSKDTGSSPDCSLSPQTRPLRHSEHNPNPILRAAIKTSVRQPDHTHDHAHLHNHDEMNFSVEEDDDTDTSDFDRTPPFENQVKDWLSGGWERTARPDREDGEMKCGVDRSLPRTYDPSPKIAAIGWSDPAPPPPVDLGMSAAESTKKVNEYKRLRKKSQREGREVATAARAGGGGPGTESGKGSEDKPVDRKGPPQRPPIGKKPVPLGQTVMERGWAGSAAGVVAPLTVQSSTAIEGYEPKSKPIAGANTTSADTSNSSTPSESASTSTTSVGDGNGTDDEGDSDIGEDLAAMVQVAPESIMAGLSFNPFAGAAQGAYGEAERLEDERILKEIAAEAARERVERGVEEEEDEEEEEGGELDAVTKRNFFGDMWMALEDMFGFEAISWLNGIEREGEGEGDGVEGKGGNDSDEDVGMDGVEDAVDHDGSDRHMLSTHSMNSRQSLMALLARGVKAAEKAVNVSTAIACNPAMLGKYNESKNLLLKAARVGAANPAFNSQQWAFFGLLLIDAVLVKKVFTADYEGVGTGLNQQQVDEAKSNWNARYEAFAAGILGGAEAVTAVLTNREFSVLRQFFDVDLPE